MDKMRNRKKVSINAVNTNLNDDDMCVQKQRNPGRKFPCKIFKLKLSFEIFLLSRFLFQNVIVCRFKAHKRCAAKAPRNCKWTTVDCIPPEEQLPAIGNHDVSFAFVFTQACVVTY